MNNQNFPTRILISGEGGQGVQVMAKILASTLFNQKYEVVYMPHYGVEMRMGISLAYIQIGVKPIFYPKFEKADIIIVMTSREIEQTKRFINHQSIVVNGMNLNQYLIENNLPIKSLNMILLGVLVRKLKDKIPLKTEAVISEIKNSLNQKKGLDKNLEAFGKGMNLENKLYGLKIDRYPKINLKVKESKSKEKNYQHWPSHCKGCGLCIEKCPVQALSWSKTDVNYLGQPVPIVDIDKCIACGMCEQICPDVAIKVIKRK